MQTERLYRIGGKCFRITGAGLAAAVSGMPGFDVFLADPCEKEDFTCCYGGTEKPPVRETQYRFGSDGVESVFHKTEEGYLLQMKHENGAGLELWSSTSQKKVWLEGDLMPQMLRFALWLGYGLMTVCEGRIPIHGSCIENAGKAWIFLGESGTGKSTHTRLWRDYIAGSRLLNDDSPIIVSEEDGIWIYGSPWSGKTPCYRRERYPLKGCIRLSQAPQNRMERLRGIQAFAALHPSCPPEFAYDERLYGGISRTLDRLLSTVPVFHLACLPDKEAAFLSYNTLNSDED